MHLGSKISGVELAFLSASAPKIYSTAYWHNKMQISTYAFCIFAPQVYANPQSRCKPEQLVAYLRFTRDAPWKLRKGKHCANQNCFSKSKAMILYTQYTQGIHCCIQKVQFNLTETSGHGFPIQIYASTSQITLWHSSAR